MKLLKIDSTHTLKNMPSFNDLKKIISLHKLFYYIIFMKFNIIKLNYDDLNKVFKNRFNSF